MNIAGVEDVNVDLANKQAIVTHAGVALAAMQAAVDDAGYEVVAAS